MLGYLSTKCADAALKKGLFISDEYEVYQYAYFTLMMTVFSWGTIFLIGIFTNCFMGTISFLVTFIPLRIYAGGFHAKKYLICFSISTLAFICMITIYWVWYNSISSILRFMFLIMAAILIFLLCPLESENKPLSNQEAVKYRKISVAVLTVEVLTVSFLLIFECFPQITAFMIMAIFFESFLIVLGLLEKLKKNTNKSDCKKTGLEEKTKRLHS